MEKRLKRTTIYEGKIINLYKDDVILDDNSKAIREVVMNNGGACIALKKNDKYLMVKQYRYAQEVESLEFVAGKIEVGDTPLETVIKESHEEVGYEVKNIKDLGFIATSPAFLNERVYLFKGEVKTYLGQNLDQGEFLTVYEYTLPEIIKMINEGLIIDSKTICLAYKLLNLDN